MSKSAQPRSLVVELLKGIRDQNENALSKIIHPNAKIEYPYALPGCPNVLTGINGILKYLKNLPFESYYDPNSIKIHSSKLEQHIVVEFEATEKFKAIDRVSNQSYISLIKIQSGQIIYYREYFNPILRIEGLLNLDSMTQDPNS